MLKLPSGCACSEPTVFPKNWKLAGANVKLKWRVQFYFYDPQNPDPKKRKKFCLIKGGINTFKTLEEKREATGFLLKEAKKMLLTGYNFITGQRADMSHKEVQPQTPFLEALWWSQKQMPEGTTKQNTASALRRIEKAANALRFNYFTIQEVRRKHFKKILDECGRQRDEKGKLLPWTACTYNHYRSYLMMLIPTLLDEEIIDSDPVGTIKKKIEEEKYREVLTPKQRQTVNDHFKNAMPNYWRFLHIFFHSGARVLELLKLKPEDVDIEAGIFKIWVRKGKKVRQDARPIKDVVKTLWVEVLQEADTANQPYLFGPHLKPGARSCTRDWVTRIWNQEVKTKLGIDIDLYSLKHLNLDETAKLLDLQKAATMAGHTSTVVTMKYYAYNEKQRELDRLKKVDNAFA